MISAYFRLPLFIGKKKFAQPTIIFITDKHMNKFIAKTLAASDGNEKIKPTDCTSTNEFENGLLESLKK